MRWYSLIFIQFDNDNCQETNLDKKRLEPKPKLSSSVQCSSAQPSSSVPLLLQQFYKEGSNDQRKKQIFLWRLNARTWPLRRNWARAALEQSTKEPSMIPDRYFDLMLVNSIIASYAMHSYQGGLFRAMCREVLERSCWAERAYWVPSGSVHNGGL